MSTEYIPGQCDASTPKAEEAVVGCCLEDSGTCIPMALEKGVTGSWFADIQLRALFQALLEMHESGTPIDDVTLDSNLRKRSLLDAVGGWDRINALHSAVVSTANFPLHLDDLKASFKLRVVSSAVDKLRVTLQHPATDPVTASQDFADNVTAYIDCGERRTFPRIVSAAEFMEADTKEPEELIQGILYRGNKLMLGGASKSNKTWTFVDMALSVAAGSNWLGFDTVQGRVLFVNLEIEGVHFKKRLDNVRLTKRIGLDVYEKLDLLNLRGFAADYRQLLPQIKSQAKKGGYSLLVLDPIYKMLGEADENSASDVTGLLNAVEALAVNCNTAVAFASHFSKGGQSHKQSMDRVSGSGVWARDADSILTFTAHEEPEAFTVEATLRNFRPLKPFVLRWRFPLMERDNGLDPSNLRTAGGSKPKVSDDKLVALLPPEGLLPGEWRRLAEAECEMPESTFNNRIKKLREAGRVTKSVLDDKYRPADSATLNQNN